MAHVRIAEHFGAPSEHVFDLLIDVRRWPEWMAGGIEVKEVTGPLDRAGTKVLTSMKFLGRTAEGWDEVVEAERPRLWKWAGQGTGMKYTSTIRLTPAGDGCDVVMEGDYELPAGFLGHVADRLFMEKAMERQMRHSVENFKALAESEVLVPA